MSQFDGEDAVRIPSGFRTDQLTLPDATDNDVIPSTDPKNPWQGDMGFWLFSTFVKNELDQVAGRGRLLITECDGKNQKFENCISGKFYEINSQYRAPTFNKNVGGVGDSRHTLGKAIDFDGQHQPYDLLKPKWIGLFNRRESFRKWIKNQASNVEDVVLEDNPQHVHAEWVD